MPENSVESEETKVATCGYTVQEYMLYKLDRTMAIAGLVVSILYSIHKATPEAFQIANIIAAGLVGYVGGRSGSN